MGEFYGVHNWLILVTPLILEIQHSFLRILSLGILDLAKSVVYPISKEYTYSILL